MPVQLNSKAQSEEKSRDVSFYLTDARLNLMNLAYTLLIAESSQKSNRKVCDLGIYSKTNQKCIR